MGLTGRRRGALAAAARGLGAAAVILALAACEGRGIFYTLATEAPRNNGNLNDELTATAVVRAGGYYYLAAGGMWRRPPGRDEIGNWQPVARPRSGGEELLVLGLAAAGNDLCAGTQRGLFRAAAAASPDWKQVGGVDAEEQVQRVFAVPGSPDGKLLAITITKLGEAQHTYRVYASDADCRSFSPVADMQAAAGAAAAAPGRASRDTASRPVDAAYAFGAYWMTAGATLYRGETLDDKLVEHDSQPGQEEEAYEGVFLNDGRNRLYVAGNGFVHSTTDGNTWNMGEIKRQPSVTGDDNPVPLTSFTQIRGTDTILIGTRNQGFYRFEDDETPKSAVRGPRLTSQLYEAHVTGFARFGSVIFATTAGDGLSSIDVSKAGGRLGTWDWE